MGGQAKPPVRRSWATLPPETLGQVFSLLTPRDLARAECVCTSWLATSKLCRRLWRARCLASDVREDQLVPARHWDAPTYASELHECDWRTSCLRAHALAVAMKKGNLVSKPKRLCVRPQFPETLQMGVESGDRRLVFLTEYRTVEGCHHHLVCTDRHTGRVLWDMEMPIHPHSAANAEASFAIGEGYCVCYGNRYDPGSDLDWSYAGLWRTHSNNARRRTAYADTSVPPRGAYTWVRDLPQFHHASFLRFHVDRKGQETAAAVLVGVEVTQDTTVALVYYLEQGFWLDRMPLDMPGEIMGIAVDDDYLVVYARGNDMYYHHLQLYKRATGECLRITPPEWFPYPVWEVLERSGPDVYELELDGEAWDQGWPRHWHAWRSPVMAKLNIHVSRYPARSQGCQDQHGAHKAFLIDGTLILVECTEVRFWPNYKELAHKLWDPQQNFDAWNFKCVSNVLRFSHPYPRRPLPEPPAPTLYTEHFGYEAPKLPAPRIVTADVSDTQLVLTVTTFRFVLSAEGGFYADRTYLVVVDLSQIPTPLPNPPPERNGTIPVTVMPWNECDTPILATTSEIIASPRSDCITSALTFTYA